MPSHIKRYLIFLNLLFIAAAVYFGVKIFYGTTTAGFDGSSVGRADSRANAASARRTAYPFSHYGSIIERNLFNTRKEALEDVEKVDVGSLEQTELKLKLLGTVTGDENSAYAVIEDEKMKQQNLFKVGDEIQSATLKMILREKVILSVNGRDEVLDIEKINSNASGRSRANRTRAPSRASRPTATAQTQRINLKRSVLDEASGNMNQLMKDVSIQPHFEDGKAGGLRLSRVNRDSVFRKMGLRRGDIITGVDGKAIESVEDALSLYDSLKSATNVKIEIKRRGKPRTLDYNIQ
jgi:general secretion pathway protein C